MLAAALAYAAAGLHVFPLHSASAGRCTCGVAECGDVAKHPRTAHGLKDATTDPARIAEWWRRWPTANVAIRTGAVSGLVVLDVDPRHGGAATLAELERQHGKLPKTARALTGSGGQHIYFRHPGGELRNSAGSIGDGLDVRGDGGYVVAPPSLHESARRYRWMRELERGLDDWPAWLLDDPVDKRRNGAAPVAEIIPEGRRRAAMLTIAGKLKRAGLTGDEILPTLRKLNERCRPPLDEAELRSVALHSTIEPAAAIPTVKVVPPQALEQVEVTVRRHLHLPDLAPLHVMLATEIANRIPEGDPVWVVIVAGSSRGKTELLLALKGRPDVRVVGALTVAALLSGTPGKDRGKDATGGVLIELGDSGLVVIKDLGAILSLQRDTRAQVLQALRDVYDGIYTRDVGADGGRKLHWSGRVGLLAGATTALDQSHAVMAVLGERWLTLRLPPGEEDAMARQTLRGADTEAMRTEVRDAVQGFLDTVTVPALRLLDTAEENLLVALSVLVCFARSPVERERDYKREIVLVHQPEGPGRIARQLHKLYVALEAIGVDASTTLVKVGLDSIPSPRRDVLLHLLSTGREHATSGVAQALALPRVSAERALEELNAHGLLSRRKSGDKANSSVLWQATDPARGHWKLLAPYTHEWLNHADSC
jgi:hypothetical protein